MNRNLRLVLFFLLLFVAVIPAAAQDEAPPAPTTDEALVITWPLPVTEVWGTGNVLGTVNVPNMVYYYLEYKQLSDDLIEPANAPWVPATVAISEPVIDGSLATLDTTTVADGLYSLRLTVNTEDGQSFHYTVSPVRVNNARFEAVIARILAEAGVEPDEDEEEVAPPEDDTPRVTPSGVAVNVRRCTLVDNDRCPVVEYLSPAEFGTVIGRNNTNTWFQIRLESGVAGWVSRTVILETGDFSNVPVAAPPAPLPPPQVANVVPNGMAIQGGRAVCNQQFNVQINVGNLGNGTSEAGTVTLQDVNVRTGEVTFTGYGNYPAISPGGNYVVVIPMTTSVYYNEQHELRAFTNGQQFTIRYTLEQGSCNVAPTPRPPQSNQRTFAADECSVVLTRTGGVSLTPTGQVQFVIDPGTYSAVQVQQAANLNWYEINYAGGTGWLPDANIASYEGNCGL